MTASRSTPLPAEFVMLADDRLPADRLADLALRARRLKVAPVRALFTSGAMTPQPYTAALARFWRAPMMEASVPLHPDTGTAALVEGFARLADGRWLISSDSPSLPRLMGMAGEYFRHMVVLANPVAFKSRVRRALADEIARQASLGLAERQPELSYRQGAALWQKALGMTALIALFVAAAIPSGIVAMVGLSLCSLMFLAQIVFHVALMLEPDARELPKPHAVPDEDLPQYGVLVPLYRETRVVPDLVRAMTRLDYPREKLDIRFLVESNDRETYDALQAEKPPPWMQIIVVPPGEPRTKPRALNAGLIGMSAEFVVIYDAEDEPEPMQLRDAVAHFRRHDDRVVCLQGRLAIDNSGDNHLTALFAMEYAGLFEVIKPGLARMGLPVPLGGTSNHFRRAKLVELGGWDAWNVTEDADLGIRIARAGLLVADLPSTTYEEAPRSIKAWLPQRRRWLKGWLQTIITHTRSPWRSFRELGPLGSLAVVATIGGMIAGALAFPILTGLFVGRLLSLATLGVGGPADWLLATLALLVFCGGGITIIAPVLLGLQRRGQMELASAAPLLVLYNFLIFVAAWGAVLELVRAPFQWNKTEHGLGTTSLRGRASHAPRSVKPPRSAARSSSGRSSVTAALR